MLFYPQGYQKPVRVQGAFVSDNEVSDVVEYLTEKNGVGSYDASVEEKVKSAATSSMLIRTLRGLVPSSGPTTPASSS